MHKSKISHFVCFLCVIITCFFSHTSLLMGEIKYREESHDFTVNETFGSSDTFMFYVNTTGKIEVSAKWEQKGIELAVILNGPYRKEFLNPVGYYERIDNTPDIDFEYNVTPEDIERGNCLWEVSVMNFKGQGAAKGTVEITYPQDEDKMVEVPGWIYIMTCYAEKLGQERRFEPDCPESQPIRDPDGIKSTNIWGDGEYNNAHRRAAFSLPPIRTSDDFRSMTEDEMSDPTACEKYQLEKSIHDLSMFENDILLLRTFYLCALDYFCSMENNDEAKKMCEKITKIFNSEQNIDVKLEKISDAIKEKKDKLTEMEKNHKENKS